MDRRRALSWLSPTIAGLFLACSSPKTATPAGYLDPGAPVDVAAPSAQQEEYSLLAKQVSAARELSLDKFKERYPVKHVAELGYDPSRAEFLDKIQRSTLALTPAALDALRSNGFSIQKKSAFPHFQAGYESIYTQDLPLYVTADSLLEAVHKSYDEVMKLIEINTLAPSLRAMLNGLGSQLANGKGNVGNARRELDLYLTVARSLLEGTVVAAHDPSLNKQVNELVELANAHQGIKTVVLFGVERVEDFSQFEPRGHYTDSLELQQYFRAMMWLGRLDFRLLETQDDGSQVFRRRQADAVFALFDLFDEQALARFTTLDSTIAEFVGESDYMTLPQVATLLTDLGAKGAGDTKGLSDQAIASAIVKGGYGAQRIASHFMTNNGPTATVPLNRSFALLGQRYVLDSHVFSNVVWDRTTAMRMMPNPLDVAFAALSNNQAASLLTEGLDRYKYQGNLAAMRVAADAHGDEYWSANLYNGWLNSLRQLSPKDRAGDMPSVTGTEAWGRRLLNTQLASWAELRHDTILYAKQSYTTAGGCEYPDAYVDPYPEFFAALTAYAERALKMSDRIEPFAPSNFVDRLRDHFTTTRSTTTTLGAMAQQQLSGIPFTNEQLAFINEAVRIDTNSGVCGAPPDYLGWYPRLFFSNEAAFDPTIADVHTQPTDEAGAPVGRVLHVGTGEVRPMVVTVNTCVGPRAYVGLVSSYHEVVTEDFKRLTDEEWTAEYFRKSPPEVEWMQSLVQK